jgi:squalene-associated FAD-dependent desaturase
VSEALVVGAGWAGLAAAVGLVEAGWRTTVIDAAPQPGGRARSQTLRLDATTAVEVDNGQHLLIGAYRSTLALVRRVGVDPDAVLARSRMRLAGPDGFELRAAPLPAPLHLGIGLLAARGLPGSQRLAMVRAMTGLALRGPSAVPEGATVADWLAATRQPAGLVARIWAPLCVGALNTPPERACARAFAQVLCDALLARAADSDFLLPRGTLGEVLPGPAAAWLAQRGAVLRWRTACRGLALGGGGRWTALTDAGPVAADRVVLAVPPPQASRLLAGAVPDARRVPLDAFEHEPIATVWLAWERPLALPEVTMLDERPAERAWGQWLFGRAAPADGSVRALAGVVVSAAGRLETSPDALAAGVAAQVAAQLALPPPSHARAVVEKRATIRCAPERPRLDVDELADVAPGLSLAGDWVWHRYPATIESAVRAGDAAARHAVGGEVVRA